MSQLNIILVGYGYWGPKLARNIEQHSATRLVGIVDPNPERREQAEKEYPGRFAYENLSAALAHLTQTDAVVIATPPGTHAELAHQAINCNKHVLIEKPMTLHAADAERLVVSAKARDCILMVDHVYCYSTAAAKIKYLLDHEQMGKLLYIDSTRINLGLFQHNCDAVWDLAVHDFSLIEYFFPALYPKSVTAVGTRHYTEYHDSAHINIDYAGIDAKTHIHVNWLSPVKVRQMIIACSQKSIIWNDMNPVEPIKIYDSSAKVLGPDRGKAWQMEYRRGDIRSPRVDSGETLGLMLSEFIVAILKNRKPRTSGDEGLRVVKQLHLASQSLRADGAKQQFEE